MVLENESKGTNQNIVVENWKSMKELGFQGNLIVEWNSCTTLLKQARIFLSDRQHVLLWNQNKRDGTVNAKTTY